MERYTSALAMHSKKQVCSRHYAVGTIIYFILLTAYCLVPTAYCLLPTAYSYAEVIDRVAAFIDDEAITLSEFREYYRDTIKVTPDISERDAMETLLNRRLLLREANRLRLRGETGDELIDKYIDIKVRAFIRVSDKEIAGYYRENIGRLGDKQIKDVERDIERLLLERKVNIDLRRHLEELREKSYIKINIRSP